MTLKVLEGDDRGAARRAARGDHGDTRGKLGGLLIRPAARRLRTRLDPDTYGGAYLLGLRGLAVIAHGDSSRSAIANAIRVAARGVGTDRRRRRAPAGAAALDESLDVRTRSPVAVYDRRASHQQYHNNEVTWQRRVKRSSSASKRY